LSKRYQVLDLFAKSAPPLARGAALEKILCDRAMYCGRRRSYLEFALNLWGVVVESRQEQVTLPDLKERALAEVWPAATKKLVHVCGQSGGDLATLTERLARVCEHGLHPREWRILLLSAVFATRSGPLDRVTALTLKTAPETAHREQAIFLGTAGSSLKAAEVFSLEQLRELLGLPVAVAAFTV